MPYLFPFLVCKLVYIWEFTVMILKKILFQNEKKKKKNQEGQIVHVICELWVYKASLGGGQI